jgi:hypothetical protein
VDEYRRLISSVGWKPRDTQAISRALASSLFAVCAQTGGEIVGMGRVIGDGGLHYYVTTVGGAGDNLHPNRLGYVAMGMAIDLELVAPVAAKAGKR